MSASSSWTVGGQHWPPVSVWECRGVRGRWNKCRRNIEVTRELERYCCLHIEFSGRRSRVTNSKQLTAAALGPTRKERKRTQCGIASREKSRVARMTTGSHSALIVPLKRANPTLRGACGGKRGVGALSRWREIQQTLRHLQLYQRNSSV